MWKCIRCEKENKDTAEICTECGHGRTMDYVQHRTVSKISAKLAKNWKISRNTEREIKKLNNEDRKKIQDLKKEYRQTQLQIKKDIAKENSNENRKNAEEFIQKKLSSLRSSVTSMKDEISKEQDEIDTLHGTIEERNKLMDKDAKAEKITTTIAWIITICLIVYIVGYICWSDGIITWDATKQFWGLKTDGGLDIWNILQVAATVVVVLIVSAIAVALVLLCGGAIVLVFPVTIISMIMNLFVGRFIGKVSAETLKQARNECDNAYKSIDEKKNKIDSIQSNANQLEHQIQRIEKDKKQIIDRLAEVSLQEMEEVFKFL